MPSVKYNVENRQIITTSKFSKVELSDHLLNRNTNLYDF